MPEVWEGITKVSRKETQVQSWIVGVREPWWEPSNGNLHGQLD